MYCVQRENINNLVMFDEYMSTFKFLAFVHEDKN